MAAAGTFRDALVARLKYLIELRGKSVARVEKELGRSRGFLGDALRGGKRLPIETILEVLALLRVDPAQFFAGATEDPLRRIRDDLGDGSIAVEDVARTLRAVVRLLEKKGYLSREELGVALRPSKDPVKRS